MNRRSSATTPRKRIIKEYYEIISVSEEVKSNLSPKAEASAVVDSGESRNQRLKGST